MSDMDPLYQLMESSAQDMSEASVQLKQMMTGDINADITIPGYGAMPSFAKQVKNRVGEMLFIYPNGGAAQQAINEGRLPNNWTIYVQGDDTALAYVYSNNNGVLTPVLLSNGQIKKTPTQKAYEDLSARVTVVYDFLMKGNFGYYKGSGRYTPIAIDANDKMLLGYDASLQAMIGAGIMTKAKVEAIVDDALSLWQSNLGIGTYIGTGDVVPVIIDLSYRVLLGYKQSTGQFIGAFSASASSTATRTPATPLTTNLKPIATAVNIVLGYGQSLSVGATATTILSTTQPYSNLTFASGPRAYQNNYSAQGPLVEDNRSPAPDGGTNRGETFCSGTANYALTLAATENGVDPASHVIFAHTAGKGGTKIADLVKGSTWYNTQFLGHVNGANALNPGAAVHVIPWAQGETDLDQSTPTTYAAYRSMFEQFQVDAETDIKAVNGQTSPVHILSYQTSYKARTSSNVALAQLDLCQKNPKFHLTTPCYHLPFYTDGTHLTNVGYKWLGAYMGRAYKALMFDGVNPQFINPVSATLRGTTLTVKFKVPWLPLKLDRTTLAPTTDNGFKVVDANGAVSITGMAVDNDTVQITLAAAPTGTTTVRYGLDYLGTGLNIVNGGSGNLRDSDPTTINIANVDRPLYSVCPHFQLNVIRVGE